MMMQRRTATPTPPTGLVGVIGGMGPLATAEFYRKVVAASPATHDQDHVPLLIWGDPRIPDRSDALINGGPDPTDWIRSAAEHLIEAGAQKLVVPCNTAHAFLDRALSGLRIPLVSMVDQTVAETHRLHGDTATVAILGTDGTIASGMYHTAFAHMGVRTVSIDPALQQEVMQTIRLVKASQLAAAKLQIKSVISAIRDAGATVVIAACTELPLALEAEYPEINVLDPMGLTAAELVRQHFQPTAA
ncbi:cysteate racemase [Leucobacter sp. HY1908]